MDKQAHQISKEPWTLSDVSSVVNNGGIVSLTKEVEERVEKCRSYLEGKLTDVQELYYGINTGFGSLCNIRITDEEIEDLQYNLVVSHACGMGEQVQDEIARLILLLKIRSLSYGHSGITTEVLKRLLEFYNVGALPLMFQQGSLGASGDLAPLAHLSLALIGKGKMRYQGENVSALEIHEQMGWKPIRLKAKEGLALLNGTQFSLAYSLWSSLQAKKIARWADLIAAISMDAFECKLSPFDERLHLIRPHDGQLATAKNIRTLLSESEIAHTPKAHVQDPYAFRCVPQVHGASKDAIGYVSKVVETEMNSVTDNPNLFPDDDAILSGGNFHAQPLALASDFLAIALSELGAISERRVYQLIGGHRNLPVFLTKDAGLHSGYMIPQYTAASIASQNKQLCTPASVDSIVSCNGQEDHVSMAANAGTKLYKVVKNVESLLAIELLVAAQAIEFRRPKKSSPIIESFLTDFRKEIPMMERDRIQHDDMQKAVDFLRSRTSPF